MHKILILSFLTLIILGCNDNGNSLSRNCIDFEVSELSSFSLKDLNPTSETYEQIISSATFSNTIRLFYFSNKETWGLCISRFDSLNDLYLEYHAAGTEDIKIIGIGADNSSDVLEITAHNNLPWVKDNTENNIWTNWDIANRDLIFMNKNDEFIFRINITNSFDKNLIKEIILEINNCES